MAEVLFWLSLSFVVYVYAGYPAILLLRRRLAPRPVTKAYGEPPVTLIMAAHNEKEKILRKLRNCLSLDYPRERVQIIVSLDGPTDGTEVVALSCAAQGVQVSYTPSHKGKATAINAAVERARGEILVFVDARQLLDRRAIRELTANFSDPSVGAVSGELMILDEKGGEAVNGQGLYWRYEKLIRAAESAVHSAVGATGALYAIRHDLFRRLPEDTILDDVYLPMCAAMAGRRVIFESRARAYDTVSPTVRAEFRRKVRTLTGNFQLLAAMPSLLNPARNPIFFQFVSHKVARLFVPYFLLMLLLSNLFLLRGGYLIFFVLQALWYSLALAGHVSSTRLSGRAAAPPTGGEMEGQP